MPEEYKMEPSDWSPSVRWRREQEEFTQSKPNQIATEDLFALIVAIMNLVQDLRFGEPQNGLLQKKAYIFMLLEKLIPTPETETKLPQR
jgi:hypothetical protein